MERMLHLISVRLTGWIALLAHLATSKPAELLPVLRRIAAVVLGPVLESHRAAA